MTEQQLGAMRQALDALESYHGYMEPLLTVFGGPKVPAEQSTTTRVEKAITTLRTVIEQTETAQGQEPVAWMMPDGKTVDKWGLQFYGGQTGTPLYTTPPAAQPALKPLTDEEIIGHFKDEVDTGSLLSFADGVRFAEVAHGITGETK